MNLTDRPLAAPGLDSYRYAGPMGYVMIGATSTADALRQAARSLDRRTLPTVLNLERWDPAARRYVPVGA